SGGISCLRAASASRRRRKTGKWGASPPCRTRPSSSRCRRISLQSCYSRRPQAYLRIGEPQRKPLFIGDDLLERLAEIELEIFPFRPAEMRRAENVGHRQEWMLDDRLVLVHIDGGVAGPALAQRGEQGSRRDELGARGVDDERRRFHAVEVVGADDAACLGREP